MTLTLGILLVMLLAVIVIAVRTWWALRKAERDRSR
jgi:hypothetical protein